MALTNQQKRFGRLTQRLVKDDGIQSVRCRICRGHFRVISGRHLSKHDTDRQTYMEEYGLTPDELIAKDFRVIQSSRCDFVPNGRREWISAIRNVYKRDGNITAKHLQRTYPHLYAQGVWIFGNWNKALRTAGFDPERVRIHLAWDEDAIIRKIRRLRNRRVPLYAKYVMKNYKRVFCGALRLYGTWDKALLATGMATAETHFPRMRPLAVLRALRDLLQTGSRDNIPGPLRSQAEYYFGSLRRAIVALKKDKRLLRGWSKLKIIKVLARMHRSKKNLSYVKARRTQPALVSAAEAYFGSWGKALYAAGIDPNLYFVHHRWRKAA
jgi:hypothetical protein